MDAAVEVLAQALVCALGVEQLESPVPVSGTEEGSKRFRRLALAEHAIEDAVLHWCVPEGIEVDRHWLTSCRGFVLVAAGCRVEAPLSGRDRLSRHEALR